MKAKTSLTLACALLLAGCSSSTTNPLQTLNTKVVDPLFTVLSRIGNTNVADLQTAIAVAKAATPEDTPGETCAGAAITVNQQVNAVFTAAAVPTAGVFTTAEVASLFKPGSPQYQNANNTLAAGCIAKANNVMGPTAVVAAGGVAGVLATTNQLLPLAAAAP